MNELIIATSNAGKLQELQDLLSPIQCKSQIDLGIESVDETGLSFIENAILKARHASRLANRPALADDSGLVVPALNGQPGIYSARFAGALASDSHNIDFLLNKMAEITDPNRSAYFYCAIAVVKNAVDPTPLLAIGQFNGIIARAPIGSHGFGYDPIFYLPAYHCTLAQLPSSVKNEHSHRALALRQLKEQLLSWNDITHDPRS